MLNPRVAGASSVLPAHSQQRSHHTLPVASAPFVPKSRWHHRQRNPLRLTSGRASEHTSSDAGHRLEFFSRGCRPPPHIYSLCATNQTMIPSGSECVERRLVGENAKPKNVHTKQLVARIRKQLLEVELFPSAYDTAWVAMVPLPGSPQDPRFPQCVDWILQNQQEDGSWGLIENGLSANKNILLSTLACVLALQKWNVGQENINRGTNFIARNFFIAMDEKIDVPMGFNIIFSGMLSLGIEMGLQFTIRQIDVDGIFHIRDMELKRHARENSCGRDAYMVYVSEGLGNQPDWNVVMEFQRKNGSFFNSPSTTAAVLAHHYDDKALGYLDLLLSKFGSAVPAIYPFNIHSQLSMVDSIEKMGISHIFSREIKGILDMTYSFWLRRDEEIMLDVATCAMAFRILRMNRYDISADDLSHVAETSTFRNSLQGYLNDTKSILELYKASKVSVSEKELILDNLGYWSGSLLSQKLCSDGVQKLSINGEIDYALKFPFYSTLERLEHKRNIEHFAATGPHVLKTKHMPCPVNRELLTVAAEDYTFSQSIYQNELLSLDSWVKENRMDELHFARQKLTYCYLSAAATIFPPELSDARIAWAKNGVLITIVDDFFDIGGSREELENFIALVEKWDDNKTDEFYSEAVKILFYAVYTTINELGSMASAVQNRCVRNHLIETWQHVLRCMMTEAEWQRTQYVPSMEEYMQPGIVTLGLGLLVFSALYFVGENLSESVVKDKEYDELFRLMSTCGRFLNDIQGFEREGAEGKLNSVLLLVLQSGGSMSIEESKKMIQLSIDTSRRDLLRLVLKEDTVVPTACKDLFWKMCKILHLFYFQTDGFSSPKEMARAVNAVITEPLKLSS